METLKCLVGLNAQRVLGKSARELVVDMNDGREEAGRGVKRRWQDWEPDDLRSFFDGVPVLHIVPEEADEIQSLSVVTKALLTKFDQEVNSWQTAPDLKSRMALLVLALSLDEDALWTRGNDVLVTRIFGTLFFQTYRAHLDGVRVYHNGAWKKVEEIREDHLRDLESALLRARAYFVYLMSNNVAQTWQAVFNVMKGRHAANWDRICSADLRLPSEQPAAVWALDMAKVINGICSTYLKKGGGKEVLESFGTFFQTDRPQTSGVVTCDNAAVKFLNEAPFIEQVGWKPENNSYLYLPVTLQYAAADADVERLRKFLTTTYAGNDDGRHLDLCMEALCIAEEMVPPMCLIPMGDGEDGKSMRTELRQNYMGEAHAIMSPKCFQIEEEFRKQGNAFADKNGITIQECQPGVSLCEEDFKNWASGGKLPCRPLFGKTTVYYKWDRCGKWWEMNKAFPAINAGTTEARKLKAFIRRFRVILMGSKFTLEPTQLDADNRVFEDDPDLLHFLRSPAAKSGLLSPMMRNPGTPKGRPDIIQTTESIQVAPREKHMLILHTSCKEENKKTDLVSYAKTLKAFEVSFEPQPCKAYQLLPLASHENASTKVALQAHLHQQSPHAVQDEIHRRRVRSLSESGDP